jgi:hypothetical protein
MSDNSLLDVIGDLFNLFFIASTRSELSQLNNEVKQLKETARESKETDPVRSELNELRAANAELRLYVATLFRALVVKGIISREDLTKLVEETDAEDGKRDNAHSGKVLP